MDSRALLLSRIREVHRRWKTRLLVRGIAATTVALTLLAVLGVWGVDLLGFRPGAIFAARLVSASAAIFGAIRWILIPLLKRVPDVQIARYVEEHFPRLQDRLVTAVEFQGRPQISPGMLDLVVRDALDKTNRINLGVFSDWRRVIAYGSLGAGSVFLLFLLLQWGPAFFSYGFVRIYAPWTSASEGTALRIEVVPGDADVALGADQLVRARLIGFDARDVRLFQREERAAGWGAHAMEPVPRGSGFAYLLVDVRKTSEYYIEAAGVQSPQFTLTVSELAGVERIDVTYEFPAYSGMAPQTAENEGDISALSGTRIGLKIHASAPPALARLRFNDGTRVELSRVADREFTGSFQLKTSGSYVVEFQEKGGAVHAGSREFEVEALVDAPPTVAISKPMRDVRATNVEEVFSELKAEDDLGVARVELHYSVSGGPEKTVTLHQAKPLLPAVTAAHTFFLEEFGLQPGDVVSYYGRAADGNNVTGPGVSTSDIYFIEIRPFEQKYSQNQAGGSPGGGAGGEGQEALSRQQKEIISATFKVIRDRAQMAPKEYSDGLKALALVQGRLQAQAQSVVDRMNRRGAAQAEVRFADIVTDLKNAIGEMDKAAVLLGGEKPADALPAEQKSLQWLMRAESLFLEVQISFANQGGGAGGSRANAEDLADLFELELNKLKSQYETVQRGEQQARDQKLDEALERLKELARRQQQENERNRMSRQRAGSSSGGSGSQNQRQILDEAESLRRQLQRLSRERSSPDLSRAAAQLEQAIQEMRESLQGASTRSSAQGIRALQQMEDARRALSKLQDAGLSQQLDQVAAESARLVEEQKKIQDGVESLSQQKQKGADPQSSQKQEDLAARKSILADRVHNLGAQVEELSRQSRKSQRDTSVRLNEAASGIRDKRLPERIVSGNQLLQGGYYDILKGREEYVRSALEDLNRQLESAREAVGQSRDAKLGESMDRTRRLAEGLESLQRRVGERQQGEPRRSEQASGERDSRTVEQQPGGQQAGRQQGGSQGTQGQRQTGP
jgi:hypothetical protein